MTIWLLIAAFAIRAFAEENVHPLDPSSDWYDPYEATLFHSNVDRDGYSLFLENFKEMVTERSKELGRSIEGHWILPYQRNNEKPATWMFVQLADTLSNLITDSSLLAIRDDNLNITGFANGKGQWYVFPNRKDVIPGATLLKFEDDYGSLVDGARELQYLPLGRIPIMGAFEVLRNYDPKYYSDRDLKKALATVSVAICEATRFVPVRQRIIEGWETGTSLDEKHTCYIDNWKEISCALLLWKQQNGKWGTPGTESDEAKQLKKCGICSAQETLATIDPLVLPHQCSINLVAL